MRVGAALTLRRLGDVPDARIRVAARTTANPVLRAALESIAAEELDERELEATMADAARR